MANPAHSESTTTAASGHPTSSLSAADTTTADVRSGFLARAFTDPMALIDDAAVDAVVIATPTRRHREHVIAAAERRKPTFCEKPPALSLDEVAAMKTAIERSGVFFQMGFMRRFDAGYAAAKQQIDAGRIGTPLVFKATSRDPFRPSLEYANPASSGGMLIDMGIHDFDLARWFMGDVGTVSAIGATIAYPELAAVGDIDNAIVSLTFTSGKLGAVDLTRSGIYGYDISTEILGLEGTIRIGYLRETPILVMTKDGGVSHDTVPYFMERFRDAYTHQLQDFARNVQHAKAPPITIDDGLEALRVGIAATRAREAGTSVTVAEVV